VLRISHVGLARSRTQASPPPRSSASASAFGTFLDQNPDPSSSGPGGNPRLLKSGVMIREGVIAALLACGTTMSSASGGRYSTPGIQHGHQGGRGLGEVRRRFCGGPSHNTAIGKRRFKFFGPLDLYVHRRKRRVGWTIYHSEERSKFVEWGIAWVKTASRRLTPLTTTSDSLAAVFDFERYAAATKLLVGLLFLQRNVIA